MAEFEFEEEVLSGCVSDPDFRQRVVRIVGDTECWSTNAKRFLFGLIQKLGPKDTLTAQIIRDAAEKLEDDDYRDVIQSAKTILAHAPKAKHYSAERLAEWVLEQRMKSGMRQSLKLMGDGRIEEARKIAQQWSQPVVDQRQMTVGDWYGEFRSRQDRRLEEKKNPEIRPAVPTRIPSLDRMLSGGGIRTQQCGLIVGHTGRGKSICASEFAFYSASGGNNTLLVSTEMERELVDTRLDAKFFGRDSKDFSSFNFAPRDLEEFDAKWLRLEARLKDKLTTVSVPPKTLTLEMLEGLLDELEAKGKPIRLMVLDSPDHMITQTHYKEPRLMHAELAWGIKRICGSRNMASWSTMQGPAAWIDRLMTAEAFSESYDKPRTADIVLTLNQSKAERLNEIMRLYVAKNRTGQAGELIWLSTNMALATFEETTAPVSVRRPAPPSGGSK